MLLQCVVGCTSCCYGFVFLGDCFTVVWCQTLDLSERGDVSDNFFTKRRSQNESKLHWLGGTRNFTWAMKIVWSASQGSDRCNLNVKSCHFFLLLRKRIVMDMNLEKYYLLPAMPRLLPKKTAFMSSRISGQRSQIPKWLLHLGIHDELWNAQKVSIQLHLFPNNSTNTITPYDFIADDRKECRQSRNGDTTKVSSIMNLYRLHH